MSNANNSYRPAHDAPLHRREQGQVIVMFALCATLLLLALGGALDLAAVVVQRGHLQNAADSAALAAAQTLGDGGDEPAAQTSATRFFQLNGYVNGENETVIPPITVRQAQGPQGAGQIVDVSVTRPYRTSFWGLAGVGSVSLQGVAEASSPAHRFDVFVSIDETSSMDDNDIAQLRRAAHLFVQTLNPQVGDPYSPKVAMAIFEGVRYGAEYTNKQDQPVKVALRESLILSNLTGSAPNLYTLIDGVQNGQGCGGLSLPSGRTDQPPMPYAAYPPLIEQNQYPDLMLWQLTQAPLYKPQPPPLSDFACPLKSDHRGPNRTFVGDGISAAFARGVSSPFNNSSVWDAFDYQHGGRDGRKLDGSADPALPAKRVLVLMTDGTSNIVPISPNGPGDCTAGPGCTPGIVRWELDPTKPNLEPDRTTERVADQAAVDLANIARSGPDGQPGTADDIEIYTIGFFGQNESALTSGPKPLCPAAVITPDVQTKINSSRSDSLLLAMSSSSTNSCDHYFPVAKSAGQQNDQGLPTIFSSIAGRIKRAQLVN